MTGKENNNRGTFDIRPVRQADLRELVDVHNQSFPGFFLTFLGDRFLSILYEKTIALKSSSGFVVMDCHGRVVGFVVGVASQTGFYKTLLINNWLTFALASIIPVLKRPTIIPRLIRALKKTQEAKNSAADYLLMSIAVLPGLQGYGLGIKLVEAFLAEAKRRGAKAVSLTTDKNNNEKVNRFYQQMGFQLSREYVTPEGRAMNEYVIALADWTTEKA